MPTINNHRFQPDFSKALDIESLISAPLVAVSKANAVMMQGQTRFLLEYCFNKKGASYEPVMIRMALTKAIIAPPQPAQPGTPPVDASPPGVTPVVAASPGKAATPAKSESIQGVTTHFELPLLTIIPLNSLAVDKMSIDFDLEITSVNATGSKSANETNTTITDKKPQLFGRISNDPTSKNSDEKTTQSKPQPSSTLKVNINASSLPLPKGLLAIIDLYTKSIQPSTP